MAEALGVSDHAQLGRLVVNWCWRAGRRSGRSGGDVALAGDFVSVDEFVDLFASFLFFRVGSAFFEADLAVFFIVPPPATELLVSMVLSAHFPREGSEKFVTSMGAPDFHVLPRREKAGSE